MLPPKPTPDEETGKKVREGTRNWLKYSGMAFQMIGIMLAFTLAGVYLDRYLDTSPLMTVVLALVGVGGGLYSSLRDFV